jgi:hypothetical protein
MFIKSAIVALFPAIVAAQNCADNTAFTFELDFGKEEGDITIQDCAWLTKNSQNEDDRISQYCKIGNVRFACRSTCKSCDDLCDDNKSFRFNIDNGKSQDCDWFGLNNSDARIKNYCYRGEDRRKAGFEVGASCPKACGFCPAITTTPSLINSPSTVPTKSPTSKPTVNPTSSDRTPTAEPTGLLHHNLLLSPL